MKNRAELNTEIQLEILEELQKSNAQPAPELSAQEKRFNAMKNLMDGGCKFTNKSNQKMRQGLGEYFKNRNA